MHLPTLFIVFAPSLFESNDLVSSAVTEIGWTEKSVWRSWSEGVAAKSTCCMFFVHGLIDHQRDPRNHLFTPMTDENEGL